MNNGLTKYRIKRRIGEKKDVIIGSLSTPGTYLFVSPTDTGKTYTFLDKEDGIFRLLAKKYPHRNFIIACPNRIQNEQNKKNYDVFALVGGEKYDITERICSMVYEKGVDIVIEYEKLLEELTSEAKDKDFTLVIDEAHQLMYAENYRADAIISLERLSKMAYSVAHITATPKMLLKYYKYDEVIKFELKNPKDANNLHKLFVVPSKNMDVSLIHQVKAIIKKGKKVIVMIDSKDSISSFEGLLKKQGLRVATITKENKKENRAYECIIEHELIPDNFDVILSTSAMECGTNIKNTNTVMILVIPRRDRFNPERVEQSFARLRKRNDYSILLMKDYENDENKELVSEDIVSKELEFEVNRLARDMNKVMDTLLEIGNSKEHACHLMSHHINIPLLEGGTVGKGLLEVDKENCKVIVNKKAFIIRAYTLYCSQLVDKKEKLIKCLEEHVKADRIVYSDVYTRSNEEDIDELARIDKESKAVKEEIATNARNLINSFSNDNFLLEQLVIAPENLAVLSLNQDTKDKFDALTREKKQLSTLADMVKKMEIPFSEAMKLYRQFKEPKDLKMKSLEYVYIESNKSLPLGTMDGLNMRYEYGLIRRVLDPICRKKARLTEGIIEDLIEDLLQYKWFGKKIAYKKYLKAKFDYEEIKDNEEMKKKALEIKEKRFEPIKEYIISRISLIYNLSYSDEGSIRVSSLRKKMK